MMMGSKFDTDEDSDTGQLQNSSILSAYHDDQSRLPLASYAGLT